MGQFIAPRRSNTMTADLSAQGVKPSAKSWTLDEPGSFDRGRRGLGAGLLLAALVILMYPAAARAQPPGSSSPVHDFLPDQTDSRVVTVAKNATPAADIVIVTQAVVVKESGPRAAVDRFSEVYSFSPAFVALRRDQPTEITFWNLQVDDQHDFALLGANQRIMMSLVLKPLSKTSYVFTFHRQGLFDFKCLEHQPAMNGQFFVIPP